jgi:hypothetical protein
MIEGSYNHMSLYEREDDALSGFDPQTWKDRRRKKLERRKEDRRDQLARRANNKRRRVAYDEDDDFSYDE